MNPETENKIEGTITADVATPVPAGAAEAPKAAQRDERDSRGPRGGGRGGGRGGRKGDNRPPRAKPEYDSVMLNIRRVARVVSGGRRFAFSVAIVAGNRKGDY